MNPADLPEGASPDCLNVEYAPGSVSTRRGMQAKLSMPAGTVNYTKTFKQQNLDVQTLCLDSAGDFEYEDVTNSPGVLTLIANVLNNCYAQSVTKFGREYIAFSDGKWGRDIPRQWDGTNFDRVSQDGPGAGPTSITDILIDIDTVSRTGGITTVVTTTPHGLSVGQLATISGVTDSTFNGTFPVNSIISATSFTYFNAFQAIAIQSITAISGLVTVTLTQPLAAAGIVVIGGSNLADGEFTATLVNATTFTYTDAVSNGESSLGTAYYLVASFSPLPVSFISVTGTNLANVRMLNPLPGGQTFTVGEIVDISGTSVTGIDGSQTITFVPNFSPGENQQAFQFRTSATEQIITTGTVSFQLPDGSSSGGVVAGSGLIAAGPHQLSIAFQTRQGFITRPSPPITYNAIGGFQAQITGLPIGPPNTLARILCFTPANSQFFFYIPVPTSPLPNQPLTSGSSTGTVVPDNTSTSFVVDFSDITLQSSISVDTPGNNLFNLVTLRESSCVTAYADRLAWIGTLNSITNFLNLSFDGGFISTSPNLPLGWTPDATFGGGGLLETNPSVWGFSYGAICLGGGSTTLGKISQSAYQDYLNVPILLPNTQYSIQARINFAGIRATQGAALVARLTSVSGSYTSSVNLTALRNTGWTIAKGILGTMPATIPSDMTLSLEFSFTGGFTPSNSIYADEIFIFPTNQPYLNTRATVSYVNNPESFDGVTGVIGLADAEGENLRNLFLQRENLHLVTDEGLYVTEDNGSSEPSGWSVTKISNVVGTPSIHGSDSGEEWQVIAHKNGLYMFNGYEPMKMNQEIFLSQTGSTVAWNQINWDYGHTIWVANDVANREIYMGVPVGSATTPNTVLMVDYKELNTSYTVSEQGPIHTSYAGKVISWEPGRKWSPWSVQSLSGSMILRPDGTWQLFVGNGANLANGKVYQPVQGYLQDDDIGAINSYWTTSALPSAMMGQSNPMVGLNRMFYSFLTMFVGGAGTLTITPYPLNLANPSPPYAVALNSVPIEDTECPVHLAGERMFFGLGTNAIGSYFFMSKFSVRLRSHAMSRVRHVN